MQLAAGIHHDIIAAAPGAGTDNAGSRRRNDEPFFVAGATFYEDGVTTKTPAASDFDLENPKLPEEIDDKAFGSGGYPHKKPMDRKDYEKALYDLQVELVKAQAWAREEGKRLVVVFEGRDAAGKGGTIKRFTGNLNPRYARVVALAKPTDREQGQWYFQRYIEQLPTKGEFALFDRSWYNRGVVERVMGFCTEDESEAFLKEVPRFEDMLIDDGVILIKFWLNIGREMQLKRFHERRHDPVKIWKLSPIDVKSLGMWDEYTAARNRMLDMTHTDHAPWTIIRANDKKRARLNAIRHVLLQLNYPDKDRKAIGAVDEEIVGTGPGFLLRGQE
ncbi:MAG: polyphosphate kinase 2 [Hyphomicrobiales bacterium]|nr:MAG: polyphosphate kinase 2 [Hyphomicrobiales bacterium]